MRRAFVLGGLVVLAGMLVLLVQAPPRRTGEESVTGPYVFKTSADAVQRLVVSIGDRRVAAERVAGDWRIEGRPASAPTSDALTDLVRTLITLRAVDRFRPRDDASFGLDPARATIELVSSHGRTRVALGELNAARSAVYARRHGAPQVMLVGLYLISALERVIYFASLETHPTAAPLAGE